MYVWGTEVGNHPLREVYFRLHPSFHPTAVLSLDGDIADISLEKDLIPEATEVLRNALYQAYNSSETEIANFLENEAERWFDDTVLPEYMDEVVVA